MRGIISIVVGLALIIGGLSVKLVRKPQVEPPLVVFGCFFIVLGIYRISQSR